MDNNPVNPSLKGGTPGAPSAGSSSSFTTMKLISSRTHVGPAVMKQNSRSSLSAAASKISLNNDLKVTTKSVDKPKASTGSMSILIPESGRITVPTALMLMEAWDRIYGDKPGTPDYIEKANRLNAVRNQVYASLGINPQKGVRPELTEEQRIAYSEAVKPYSFDYYEVRLSFKQDGHKAVRSKTYRFLNAPDLTSIRNKLVKQAKVVNTEFSVTQRGSVS